MEANAAADVSAKQAAKAQGQMQAAPQAEPPAQRDVRVVAQTTALGSVLQAYMYARGGGGERRRMRGAGIRGLRQLSEDFNRV